MSSNLLTLMVSATFLSLALTRAQVSENQHMAKLEESDGSESTTELQSTTQKSVNVFGNSLNCSSYGVDTDVAKILLETASKGNLKEVRCLFLAGVDLSLTDSNNNTALHLAAEHGHVQLLDILIPGGTSVNATNFAGLTPLHSAAANNRFKVVMRLLDFRPDIDAKSAVGLTPLHAAASKGNFGMVKLLIFKGADADAADVNGDTALHIAAREGHFEGVKQLYMVGATLNIRNSRGQKAYDVAVGDDLRDWFWHCSYWSIFYGYCREADKKRRSFILETRYRREIEAARDYVLYGIPYTPTIYY